MLRRLYRPPRIARGPPLDANERSKSSVLEDDAGKALVRVKWLFDGHNPTLISGKELYDVRSGRTFEAECDAFGKRVEPKSFCLDKSGGVLIDSGKPALVKSFEASQTTSTEIKYDGSFIAG